MELTQIKIDKLLYSNPNQTKKFVSFYILEPEEISKKERGQLAYLLEIEFKLIPLAEDLIWVKEFEKELADFLNLNYYQVKDFSNPEKKFEELLQKLNDWLKEKIGKEINLNLAIINVYENNILFSVLGRFLIFLFQDNKIISLQESVNESFKNFSNIVNGSLEENDQLIFSTKNLFDYFPKEKLEGLLKRKKFLKELLKTIEEFKEKISFALLIFNLSEKLKRKETKESSKILVKKESLELPLEFRVKEKITKLEEPKPRKIFVPGKDFILSIFLKLKLKFFQFSRFQRLLIFLLIFITIAFIQSLILIIKEEIKSKENEKYSFLVKEIQEKQNRINAFLIYKDESKIKLLMEEVDSLLKKFPQKTEEQKELYKLFKETEKNQLAQIYRIRNITEPKVLIDLLKFEKKIRIGGLTKVGDKIYFYNPENNFIYQFDLTENKLDLINKTSVNTGYFRKILPLDNDFLLLVHGSKGLSIFDLFNKKIQNVELVTKQKNFEIKDLAVYSNYLYVLSSDNKLYKYTKSSNGFNKEIEWLKNSLDEIISLTIDGSVYFLSKDGEIFKFYQGLKQNFKTEDIYPPFSEPIKILTFLNSQYLYILEPSEKRLVIFNKNGKLIEQIMSDYFSNLTDFAIDEKANKIWLANDTKIFEIPLKTK
jgi:hypothetical protein